MKTVTTLEQALKRLEEIVAQLNNGDVPLDDGLKLYAEAAKLIEGCTKKLDDAKLKIDTLFENNTSAGETDHQQQ